MPRPMVNRIKMAHLASQQSISWGLVDLEPSSQDSPV